MGTQNERGPKGTRETTGVGNRGTTGSNPGTLGGTSTGTTAGVAGNSTTGTTARTTQKGTKSTGENGGLSSLGVTKNQVLTAAGAIAGGALLIKGIKALTGSGKKVASGKTTVTATNSVIIKKTKAELYAYWRKLENLPNFMSHLEEVNEIDARLSEWSAEVPGGLGTIEWEAEIIREEKNRLIVWRSLPGSEIENSGEVRFEDAPGGKTLVESTISYRPPAGDVGGLAGKLLKPAFKTVVEKDLKQFKKLMEKGGKAKIKSKPANKI